MKRTLLTALFCLAALSLVGQITNTPPALPDVSGDTIPATRGEFWQWLIAGVAPLIVAGIKAAVPKIPKLLLPVSTPFIGIGLGFALNKLGASDLGWVDMAQAGALAVFIRETLHQTIKQFTATPPTGNPS